MKNPLSFDERFGRLYEDTEVRNAIFASACTTLNSRNWEIDYITGQPTVTKFDK